MVKTIRFKNVVKLFLLAIAVGLIAAIIPRTLAERVADNEVDRAVVYELKHDLVERIGDVWALNQLDFTVDSWANLYAVTINAERALIGIVEWLADLEARYLVATSDPEQEVFEEMFEAFEDRIDSESDETEAIEALNDESSEVLDFAAYYSVIFEELQEMTLELERAYNSLERVEVVIEDDEATEYEDIEEDEDVQDDETFDHEGEQLDLLSVTRQEFESMTPDEIVYMADEGGYLPVEVRSAAVPLDDSEEPIYCPNNLMNNVVVNGVICVGASDGFLAAWTNSAVERIYLTDNIVWHATAASNNSTRTSSVSIEGNGQHLVLTTRTTTNSRLYLGATAGLQQTLELNNIYLGRVITAATGTAPNNTGTGTAAEQGVGQRTALFISTPANSSNWRVYVHDRVISSVRPAGTTVSLGTSGTGNSAANAQNRSAILNMPQSSVTVTGLDNNFVANTTSATGDNAILFNVSEFNVVSLPPIAPGANGYAFAPHTRVNIDNFENLDCVIIPAGTTQTLTTVGNTSAIVAPCLIVEEDATLIINPNTLTTAHVINVTYDVVVRENGTLTINNRTGSGFGINARYVDLGTNANFTFSRTGNATVNGHGISALDVTIGDRATVEMELTVTGTGDANVTGNGFHVPNGSVIIGANAEVNITRNTGTAVANGTRGAIQANSLTVGDDATLNIATTQGTATAGGVGHGITATGLVTFGANSEVNITRSGGVTSSSINAINASGGLITEENATLYMNMSSTPNHVITTGTGADSRIEFGPSSDVTIIRGASTLAFAGIHTNDLIIDEHATVDVRVSGAGHGLYIQNLDARNGAQLDVTASGAAHTAVRVRSVGTMTVDGLTGIAGSTINIGENVAVSVLNTGTNTASDTHAGSFTQSNGLFGSIGLFIMEANSTFDLEATAIPFRTTANRTSYNLFDGAIKNVYARPLNVAGTAGRPAMVFANSYMSGPNAAEIANRNNSHHQITISGVGTLLNLEGYTNVNEPQTVHERANFILVGDNSSFNITNGAQLENLSHNTTAMIFFGTGTEFNISDHSKLALEVGGSAPPNAAAAAAVRFLEVGSATFNVDASEVVLTATAGSAPLLRGVQANNGFYVRNGGLLELIHYGTGVGIDFAAGSTDMETADRFIVGLPLDSPYRTTPVGIDCRSEIYIRTNNLGVSGSRVGNSDPAAGAIRPGDTGLTATQNAANSNENITFITAYPGTVFVVSGQTTDTDGIFRAGRLHMEVDAPLYFDFTQRQPGNALLFDTYGNIANPSTIVGYNTDLSLWRNTRAGTAVNPPSPLPGHDPIDGEAAAFFSNISYFYLQPGNNNFANVNLVVSGGSTSEPRFTEWFNGPAMPGTGIDVVTGNAGWRQIRRLVANNAHPVVDLLRTPTDADQRIFGHVTIPEGNRSARSAFDGEVFVDLVITDTADNFVQRINNVPTGIHSIWGAPAHSGIFMAEITEPFEDGTTFLPIGYTVEVVRARRTSIENPPSPSTSTTLNEGVDGNLVNPRITRPQDILCRIGDNATYCQETVIDITPPEQVEDVAGLVSGNLRFDGDVTPATTSITGTGEVGGVVRVGRVTPVSGIVSSVTWLGGTAPVEPDGTWEFMIPTNITLEVGDQLSIYISDDVRIASVTPPPLPQVIFRPHLANEDTLTWFNQRAVVTSVTLPRTAITAPWAGETMGNINYHWPQRTPFHDAIDTDAFDYAYILTVVETVESDFEFIKVRPSGSPLAGALFHLYSRTADGLGWEATPIERVTSGANGVIGFDGLSHGSQYRLREQTPAPGFVAPPANHYWVITVSNDGVIGTPMPGNADTPAFEHNDDDDLILVNEHLYRGDDNDFVFIKRSNLTHLPLAGAQFSLHRLADDGTSWDLITEDLESATTGMVRLEGLRYGSVYRLTETAAPPLYRLPLPLNEQHYWLITVDVNDGAIDIPTHHGNAPAFVSEGGNLFLPNERSTVDLFEFIKTKDDGMTPLPGAMFNLYRWDDEEAEWVQVKGDLADLVSATDTGAVRFENFLTYGSQYRLEEIDAPDGFVTPPIGHYWLITVDSEGHIETPTHHEGAPAFDDEGGLFLPNRREGVEFSFTKTNDYLYFGLDHENFQVLEGAVFTLRVWCEDTNEWIAIGAGETATSDEDGLVIFNHLLTKDGRYRLDETVAPTGFRPPAGYWEIRWDADEERFLIDARGTSGLVPAFKEVYRSVSTGEIIDNADVEAYEAAGGEVRLYLYLGNFPEIRLPGTGGFGAMSMTIIGLLSLSFVGLFYVRGKIIDDLERVKKDIA